MKIKKTLNVVFALFLASCASKKMTPEPMFLAPVVVSGSHAEKILDLKCGKTCTDKEKIEAIEIEKVVNEILKGGCFHDELSKKKIDQTKDNAETVSKKIKSAKVTRELAFFSKRRNPFTRSIVVGYEAGDGKIHANRIAWRDFDICEKSGNVAHEFTHAIGYSHRGNFPKGNENTIPYLSGEIAIKCCHGVRRLQGSGGAP